MVRKNLIIIFLKIKVYHAGFITKKQENKKKCKNKINRKRKGKKTTKRQKRKPPNKIS